MARTTKQTESKAAAPKAEATEAPDLMAALLAELKAQGVEPKIKWAPSRNYASLYVDKYNIGYVFRQGRAGMRIEPALTKAGLPKGAKGWKPGKRSERFALVGVVKTVAEAENAAAVLKAADDKRQAASEPSAADKAKAARVARAVRAEAAADATAEHDSAEKSA